jgi:23S rRNA (pseudouridine1915-N3)-methyltransferase
MRYHVVAVGRMKNAPLRAACNDYLERLRRYAPPPFEEREVKDERRLRGALPGQAQIVALSRRGQQWTSGQLAEWMSRWERAGKDVTFAVGGADELPEQVLASAQQVWSLSRLTFPHELARLILYEQLYRACTIRRHEPYHRD